MLYKVVDQLQCRHASVWKLSDRRSRSTNPQLSAICFGEARAASERSGCRNWRLQRSESFGQRKKVNNSITSFMYFAATVFLIWCFGTNSTVLGCFLWKYASCFAVGPRRSLVSILKRDSWLPLGKTGSVQLGRCAWHAPRTQGRDSINGYKSKHMANIVKSISPRLFRV